MLPAEVILAIVGGFLTLLTLFVFFSTGSILSVFMLWAVAALITVVLVYYDYIDLDKLESLFFPPEEAKKPEAPAPEPLEKPSAPMVGSEVFHVSQNQFTYDEAPAVCAAYGAKLATLEQIIDAYNKGAEWCNYGWSAGGMALYPTQKSTWDELQQEVDPGKRTACGRPGVNGGYFNPSTKFGVNCFGFKPTGNITFPVPAPGTDTTRFRDMVNKFKEMLKTFNVSPFSRQEWSGYDSTPAGKAQAYGEQFEQALGKLTEGFEGGADPAYQEAPQPNASYSAAPYGLRGDIGPTGPQGPQGAEGAASTVPGPQGPAGPQGPEGAASTVPGPAGPQGPKGDIGPQGVPGTPGAPGELGPTGPRGPMGEGNGPTGPRGAAGPQGIPGIQGMPGATGPAGAMTTRYLGMSSTERPLSFYKAEAQRQGMSRGQFIELPPMSDSDRGRGLLTTYNIIGTWRQVQNDADGDVWIRTPNSDRSAWGPWVKNRA
jgi:hypothetical protein